MGNEDDVVEVDGIPPAPDTCKLQEEVILESDDDDMVKHFPISFNDIINLLKRYKFHIYFSGI